LGILHFPSVSHAGKFRRAAAGASIRRKLSKIDSIFCGGEYHFAQWGNRTENPGCLKSEVGAHASQLFPCGPHTGRAVLLAEVESMTFSLAAFLEEAGVGRRVVHLQPKQVFFSQGDAADSVFYLRTGRAKLTVFSPEGKEATVALLSAGEFIGEESLASVGGVHMATATAIAASTALKIAREEMIRVMHEEHSLSEMYLKFLLARSMRTQADLVDQLFNSSEKRLARILLLMAEFGEGGEPEPLIPPITQETLAEMVGTTRSRVSFFMNRFRKLGLIEYKGRIRVHKSLINVILYDQFTEHASEGSEVPANRSKLTRKP
jgi:CRP-like cAMP-binding protein